MKYINNYKIFEGTIGSEAIRNRYYSDIDKTTFYKIVNLDPTSIRKDNFSKPGKYTKWLLREYNKNVGNLKDYIFYYDNIEFLLHIFSTEWFKKEAKKNNVSTDILKYDFNSFISILTDYADDFESETENAKYDVIFQDDKIKILIPLNYTASYEISKNTEWCTKRRCAYETWNNKAILFRIIPLDKKEDILKLTWEFKLPRMWHIASSKYPEIEGMGIPFDYIDDVKNWEIQLELLEHENSNYKELIYKIRKTMNLISIEAEKCIIDYYEKNMK